MRHKEVIRMELFDLYDMDRRPLGRTMVRDTPQEAGAYRLVIHICIINGRGEMLIQRRQPHKHSWPGLWDISVSGSVIAGEDSRTAAARELREELGIARDFAGERPPVTLGFAGRFDDFYLIRGEYDAAGLRLQTEEVSAARWAGRDEIMRMIDAGTFIPYQRGLIDIMFAAGAGGDMFTRPDANES
jgi:isopentenyldiphosphate isomerase